MPRPNRVHVEGVVYHVYNRFGRGERVFEANEIAGEFVRLLSDVVSRDELTVFAWFVMPNHYHLAVRMGVVPLDRPMRSLQQRVTSDVNQRRQVYGPLWQGRYRAKLVNDQRYGLRVNDLARPVRKSPQGVTRALSRGSRRRASDAAFRRDLDGIDKALAEAFIGQGANT